MHPELKFSTIRITTGLTVDQTREGLLKLLDNGIVEKITRFAKNPTFRLNEVEDAKIYLEELARHHAIQI